MGLEISKCYSYTFHSISAKLYDDVYCLPWRNINLILFLAYSVVLKNVWRFEILTSETMGKS